MERHTAAFVATTPPDFGLDIRIDRRQPDVECAASEMMRIVRPDLPDAGLPEEIRAFLGDARDCAMLPQLPDRDGLVVCPVAYALARHAGFDPVAVYALSRIGLFVGIVHPWWKAPLHVERRGHTLAMRAPAAPGAVWYGTAGPDGWLLLDPERAGIPEERAQAMYQTLPGTPVRSTVSSPVLDTLDLTFRKVTAPDWTLFSAHTDRSPDAVTLRQATWKEARP